MKLAGRRWLIVVISVLVGGLGLVFGPGPAAAHRLPSTNAQSPRHHVRPGSAAAPGRPAPVSHVHTYQVSTGASVHWKNPAASSFDHVVVRYARGYTAPVKSTLGRRVRLTGARANLAHLDGLTDDTVYTVALWTVDARGRRSTPVTRTFTSGALRGARGAYVGRVVDDAGHPLLNVEIRATGYSAHGRIAKVVSTDVHGRFRVPLGPGSWFVDIGGQHASGGDADPTGYVGTETNVVVHPGQTVHAGNVTLSPGGAITGRVTDAAGHPLAGVVADVVPVQTYVQVDTDGLVDYAFAVEGTDALVSGADGRYTIKGVPLDTALRVCLTTTITSAIVTGGDSDGEGYADRCLPSAVDATLGTVETEPDLALDSADGGEISGSVTAPSGSGLGSWLVSFEPTDDTASDVFAGDATTEPDGQYQMEGLQPGTYRVCAENGQQPTRTGYAPGCHGGLVTVSPGGNATADVRLAIGAAVTGKVIGPHGVPIAGVDVEVRGRKSDGYAATDATGHYRVKGLRSGDQIACFETDEASAHHLPTGALPACYGHRTHFSVRAGALRNGVDISLEAGAAISGTVRDQHGTPVPFVDVDVEPANFRNLDDGGFAETDAAGHYIVRGLAATSKYQVCFTELDDDLSQHESCHPGRVAATRGRTTTGIDGVIRSGASIAVTVDDTAGHPVAGVDAAALASCPDRDECETEPLFSSRTGVRVVASSTTSGAGVASLRSPKPGRYAVCLFAYYGATTSGTAADGYADRCSGSTFTVTVRAGKTTAIHEVLADGGAVSGTVTDGAGHPLGGVLVHVTRSAADDFGSDFFSGELEDIFEGNPSTDSTTRADGSYTIHGVRPGRSTVCADATEASGPDAGGYFDQCLGGRIGSQFGGSAIPVTADANHGGTDLALTPASGISGTVTDADGSPDGAADVVVFSGRSQNQVADEQSQGGTYTISQLPAGRYSVCVDAYDEQSQCYRGIAWKNVDTGPPPLTAATLVSTTTGALAGGIDFHLHR